MPGLFAAEGNVASLETILMHTSGQWVSMTGQAPVSKADPQGVGSVITYMRRYALAAVTSVVPDEDDDGNAASTPQPQGSVPKRSTKSEKEWWKVVPFGKTPAEGGKKGVPLVELTNDELLRIKDWCEADTPRQKKFAKLIDETQQIVLAREEDPELAPKNGYAND